MRKIYLVLTMLVLLMLSEAYAQKPRIGLKAGPQISTIDGKNVEDTDYVWGYNVGGMLEAPLSRNFYLQPEFLFVLKGTEDTNTPDPLTTLYLEVPIFLKLQIKEAFNIHLGPYAGLLLNSKKGHDDWEDLLNNFDYGLGAGIGYRIADRITLDLRYMYGLNEVYEDDLPESVNIPAEIRDDEGGYRVLQFSVGYLIKRKYRSAGSLNSL